MNINKYLYNYIIFLRLACFLLTLASCRPEVPVNSSITVEADGLTIPVNEDLYGLTVEEINRAIDGGLYAELIQNRSFEDGIPPLNCPYDAARNTLKTPNGWVIPFIRPDFIPGWRFLSPNTAIFQDTKELVNDKNRRSLLVSVFASSERGRGGVVAEGYKGIPVRKGQKYNLSFFAKGTGMAPKPIKVAIEDSSASSALSDLFTVSPISEWRRYQHTFTATEDVDNGVLTISSDTSTMFWIDVVSLFPERTWRNRHNGLRPDLAVMLDSLSPRFIRFPGGSFVEGYTAGTYPVWKETIGDISERKHFWNIWAYGSTNGMGYHEYLQLCEDVGAEPVYVINSGVTSQGRRPRYEDITAMDKLVEDALDAIAYANEPADSTWGSLRAKQGHPEPFDLKFVEIGSENYGFEYSKRFDLFRKAIKERYPTITIISSSAISRRNRSEWVDSHYYAGADFLISHHDRFDQDRYSRRLSALFIGEFGVSEGSISGTLRGAISEACFLIGAERNPDIVKRLAYAPMFGNIGYENQRTPLVSFNTVQAVASPSYYLLKMFGKHRGDEVLKTIVDTYERPQVTLGKAGIELFDNGYDIKEVKINNSTVSEASILGGGWKVEQGNLTPDPNRWNYILFGDSMSYAYEYTATIRRTKGSGMIQFRIRDNGMQGELANHLCMTLGLGNCELYQQSGGVRDTLASSVEFPFENNRWYTVKMVCRNERISCYIDGRLIHEVSMRPLPSLVCAATLNKETNQIYLKVVNTTQHEERTALHINGVNVKNEIEIIQLSGMPEARNTFDNPEAIVPVVRQESYSLGASMIYDFPPNSISIVKLSIE